MKGFNLKIVIGILLFILGILNICDLYTTHVLVSSGMGSEYNPLMSALMNIFGILPALIITKSLVLTLLIVIYIRMLRDKEFPKYKQYIAAIIVMACNILYLGAVLNNTYWIKMM